MLTSSIELMLGPDETIASACPTWRASSPNARMHIGAIGAAACRFPPNGRMR
jgi:hypothetical protein